MQSALHYLAIDLGTSAVKVGLIDGRGTLLALSTVEYPLSTPRPGEVECDLSTYWNAVEQGTQEALRSAECLLATHPSVGGIAISCQGETLICLDGSHQPVRPAIVWLDNRALEEAEELGSRFGLDELYRRTGQIESLATWTAAKILWLLRHEPAIHAATKKFVMLEDWLLWELCGELVGEHSMYVSTLLFDLRERRWWTAMLDAVGIDPARLPPLVPPGTRVGSLRPDAARRLGLPAGTPVISGAFDQSAAAVGAANVRPGMVTEMTGTVLGVTTTLAAPPAERSTRLPVYLHAVPDQYCAFIFAQTGGLALRWFRDHFFGPSGSESPEVPYDDLVAEAATIPPGAHGLLVLPHLAGAGFPEFDLRARGAIVGITLAHRRAHVTRAILESVGYMLRQIIAILRQAGLPVDTITSIGKSAQSAVWLQIKADICRLPIQRMACPEASLLGVAMLAAVARGEYATVTQAAEGMTHPSDITVPNRETFAAYEAGYQLYSRLYDHLAPLFHAMTPDRRGE